jgi:hypothetical protein
MTPIRLPFSSLPTPNSNDTAIAGAWLRLPTPEQIEMCRLLWTELYEAMDFRVASFCPAQLPFSQAVMTHNIENIPA